jgi:hypothetical protein
VAAAGHSQDPRLMTACPQEPCSTGRRRPRAGSKSASCTQAGSLAGWPRRLWWRRAYQLEQTIGPRMEHILARNLGVTMIRPWPATNLLEQRHP